MEASHKEKYIDAGQKKNGYFADPLPVHLLITVKTVARVSTRGSKMLPTNRTMRSDCLLLLPFNGHNHIDDYYAGVNVEN